MFFYFDGFDKNESKSGKTSQHNASKYIEFNEETLTNILCSTLKIDSNKYNIENSINVLRAFEGKRIIYSVISGFIFSISDKQGHSNEVADFTTNVDKLKELVLHNSKYNDIKDKVIRLYDHTQLANNQINVFKLNKDEFENLIATSKTINQKFETSNSQSLSLVALFTAMAFLVFGGLSSFESIFSNLEKVSTLKLIVVASVWGLGILNVIAIFMFFMSKVIGKSFRHTDEKGVTLFQKYPYLILGNYVLISIFIFSSSLFLIVKDNYDFSCHVIVLIIIAVITLIAMTCIFFMKRPSIQFKKKICKSKITAEE